MKPILFEVSNLEYLEEVDFHKIIIKKGVSLSSVHFVKVECSENSIKSLRRTSIEVSMKLD